MFEQDFPGGPIENIDGWYFNGSSARAAEYALEKDEFTPTKSVVVDPPGTGTGNSPWWLMV